jgi:thiol:disulfide interchange protein
MPATPDGRRPTTRARPTVLLVIAALLLLARVGTGIREHLFPPRVPELVRWSAPVEPGAAVPAPGKPVLYEFTADWCEPCQKMKREVFAERDSARFINQNFFPVRILDTDVSAGARALRERHRVTGFPTLLVTMPGDRESPTLAEGYQNRRATMKFLEDARERWGKARSRTESDSSTPTR